MATPPRIALKAFTWGAFGSGRRALSFQPPSRRAPPTHRHGDVHPRTICWLPRRATTVTCSGMLDPSPALGALIREVEAQAAEKPDPVAILVGMLKLVIASEADPYLLSGALVEGIASTIVRRIPDEKHGEVGVEAVRMLRDRLHAYGIV